MHWTQQIPTFPCKPLPVFLSRRSFVFTVLLSASQAAWPKHARSYRKHISHSSAVAGRIFGSNPCLSAFALRKAASLPDYFCSAEIRVKTQYETTHFWRSLQRAAATLWQTWKCIVLIASPIPEQITVLGMEVSSVLQQITVILNSFTARIVNRKVKGTGRNWGELYPI